MTIKNTTRYVCDECGSDWGAGEYAMYELFQNGGTMNPWMAHFCSLSCLIKWCGAIPDAVAEDRKNGKLPAPALVHELPKKGAK
jgi:hypothetical protein